MRDTPITDALSTDPAIDRRDVPSRVWRQMANMERDRAELIEALQTLIDLYDSRIRWNAAESSARALLVRLEAK